MNMIIFPSRSFSFFAVRVDAPVVHFVMSACQAVVRPLLICLLYLSSVITGFSQLERDGTGEVNGYQIGPGADLRSADLRGADLKGANLENADLRGANLEGADLNMASLIGCNLDGVNISGANLNGVRISDANMAAAISGAGRATYLKVIALEEIGGEHESKLGLLIDGAENREVRLGNLEEIGGEHESKLGLLIDGAENREVRIKAMEEGHASQAMEMTSINELLNVMNAKLEQLEARIPTLEAAIVERDEKIALLEKRPTMEQLMEGRPAGILLQVDEDGKGEVTLSLRIEQSEDLLNWTPVEEVIKHTFPIPDNKRFYRFALAR